MRFFDCSTVFNTFQQFFTTLHHSLTDFQQFFQHSSTLFNTFSTGDQLIMLFFVIMISGEGLTVFQHPSTVFQHFFNTLQHSSTLFQQFFNTLQQFFNTFRSKVLKFSFWPYAQCSLLYVRAPTSCFFLTSSANSLLASS
jgi:hypothetical protein